ncbi:MAG TPA: lipoate--protein ligase [Bacteroidales bacterium]|nr:lipoate--protein ligase [Bacteroidales bacterium]
MRIILQPTHDPYFNIATEEYLLKHSSDDYIILYRNTPSVIVGKHQNTMAELNHGFINSSKIPVIRRLSGGGTVFHDLGNVNFCFIANGREGNLIEFKRFTTPIIEFLKELGLNAYRGEKNDIRIGNYKVSGNAEHVYKNRVMHHGTLLYRTNMFWLEQAIKSNENSYTDRAIRSNRSQTINIAELLPYPMAVEAFENSLLEFLAEYHSATPFKFDSRAKEIISTLASTKYTDWNWNYGYNASYDFRLNSDSDILVLKVNNGIIEKVEILRSSSSWIDKLAKLLEGKRHDYAYLKNELDDTEYSEKIQEIIENLF